jgi:hypothetical protein
MEEGNRTLKYVMSPLIDLLAIIYFYMAWTSTQTYQESKKLPEGWITALTPHGKRFYAKEPDIITYEVHVKLFF